MECQCERGEERSAGARAEWEECVGLSYQGQLSEPEAVPHLRTPITS